MAKYDLVIKNGRVFAGDKLVDADLAIKNGKIAKIARNLEGSEVINARQKLVLPGAIDVHVHFREPGLTHKEDWYTGSSAAAAGGVTSVIDQPNTDPPTTTAKAFKEKLKLARQKSIVDFGINAGVVKNAALEELWKGGATAFGEIFLADSAALEVDYAFLKEALEKIASINALACIHAEDGGMIRRNLGKYKSSSYLGVHSGIRSAECEELAIRRVLELKREAGHKPRIHICHLSTNAGLKLLRQSRGVSFEITPHHLLLSLKDYRRLKSFAKVNPPLRSKVDQQALFRAFARGEIPILASDHAPHLPDEKKDLLKAPSGVPGVETMVPLLLAMVKKGLISLERVMHACSKNPARIFSLKNKGEIKPGSDADLFITDFRAMKIKARKLHSRCGWTPFEGFEAVFPELTLVRGEVVFDRDVVGKKGFGRLLIRND